ncbi:hypothetical protein SNE25_01255 [Mucilaginibacter sabulilitoris]|uniref:Uncharacterized protein n=1 Tax=Mucilaginibacter sabulilitoris TaxID=1173583 RepID=A0ABZ0TSM2_9SPHI|nr:hypothetical protein [Mucilaginibacter sabulilitoris]WPU94150.1 hypothetical protein SNE25_01255 [Mucilaginibacter sabulilitoris]
MEYEIHLFSGTACITEAATYKYPVGEKHAFLFFLRENKNSEYDSLKAEGLIISCGLNKIEFSREGKVSQEKAENSDKKKYYDAAIESGSALILYSDPI